MKQFPEKLQKKLSERTMKNSLRRLSVQNELIDFSSNDYLGLSKSEAIFEKAHKLTEKYQSKNGATGSRLLSGNYELHELVEKQLSTFFNSEATLLFNSGYDANIGLFSSVPQRGDVILYDELIHASIRDGIRLSNAKAYNFKHNNLDDLDAMLNRIQHDGETYIATESVFSMDGDIPDLISMVEICKKHKAYLIVDEAHAIGVFGSQGQGLVRQLELENDVFACIYTFGKAIGCHGAVISGSKELRSYLINFSRSFIYTTASPLHSIATIKYAFEELQQTNQIKKLQENISFFNQETAKYSVFKELLTAENSPQPKTNNHQRSSIHSFVISGNERVKNIAKKLQVKGFDVKPILSPTVTKGQERLRICLHSYNTKEQISALLELLNNFVIT